ncbi:MAG: serine hydrolase [Terracidiphilus sp.]|jgi:CubicO group peptidase (beta-lactamase class C family)
MMRTGRPLYAGAAILLFLTGLAAGQDVATNADAYLNTWAKQGRFSGTVLIARGGKILLRKGYGMANYELSVPNAPETVFRIGSITKSFTALSILRLEEQGLLKVSDPVVKYIPELPQAWNAITIHQLLCHKSGIPEFTNAKAYGELENSQHVENALKEYADKPLINQPGEVLRYSNSGYILLGRVIEKVSGQSYEDYLQTNILGPAGMTNTAFDHTTPLVPHRANGYKFDGETIVNARQEDPAGAGAAGALRSTVDDLYKFDRALKLEKLFSAAIKSKAWTAYGHWSAPPPIPLEAEYGYGWMIGDKFGHKYVGHGGWIGGFVSKFERYPDDDAVVIVLGNFETLNTDAVSQDLTAILFGEKYSVPVVRAIVHPAENVMARYVGDYHLGPLAIKITMRNGKLYMLSTGQPAPFGMIATSDTEFYFNDTIPEFQFIVNEKGIVNQILIKMGGKEFTAIRVNEPKVE